MEKIKRNALGKCVPPVCIGKAKLLGSVGLAKLERIKASKIWDGAIGR